MILVHLIAKCSENLPPIGFYFQCVFSLQDWWKLCMTQATKSKPTLGAIKCEFHELLGDLRPLNGCQDQFTMGDHEWRLNRTFQLM